MTENLTYNQMLDKLDSIYKREEDIKKQIILLQTEYEQIKEDKEMLQMMIMYKANKEDRFKKKLGI